MDYFETFSTVVSKALGDMPQKDHTARLNQNPYNKVCWGELILF